MDLRRMHAELTQDLGWSHITHIQTVMKGEGEAVSFCENLQTALQNQ